MSEERARTSSQSAPHGDHGLDLTSPSPLASPPGPADRLTISTWWRGGVVVTSESQDQPYIYGPQTPRPATTLQTTAPPATVKRSLAEAEVTSQSVRTTEDYAKQQERFYQSYNPEIGIHTAAVLGGILGWLLVYLLYKTKVKRCITGAVRKAYHKNQESRRGKKVCGTLEEALDVTGCLPDNSFGASEAGVTCGVAGYACRPGDPVGLLPQPLGRVPQPPGHVPQPPSHVPQSPCHMLHGHLCPACGLLVGQAPETYNCGQKKTSEQPRAMPSIVVESCSSLQRALSEATPHDPPNVAQSEPPDRPPLKTRRRRISRRAEEEQKKRGEGVEVKGYKHGKVHPRDRRKKYRRMRSCSQGQACPQEQTDTRSLLLTLDSQADSAEATARWVQTMPLMMRSQQDVTRLLLQQLRQRHQDNNAMGCVKQQSCPLISAALRCAALPLLGLPHLGLNNSMPQLPANNASCLTPSSGGHGACSLFDPDQYSLAAQDKELLEPFKASTSPLAKPRAASSGLRPPHPASHAQPQKPAPVPGHPLSPSRCLRLPVTVHSPPGPSRSPPVLSRSPPVLNITIPGSTTAPRLSASACSLTVPISPLCLTAWSAPATPSLPTPLSPFSATALTVQHFTHPVAWTNSGGVDRWGRRLLSPPPATPCSTDRQYDLLQQTGGAGSTDSAVAAGLWTVDLQPQCLCHQQRQQRFVFFPQQHQKHSHTQQLHPQTSHQQHHQSQPQQTPLQVVEAVPGRASWIVFDNDDSTYSSTRGKGEGGVSSKHTSTPSTCSSLSKLSCDSVALQGRQSAMITLETKL